MIADRRPPPMSSHSGMDSDFDALELSPFGDSSGVRGRGSMTVPFEADMTALPTALRYKLLAALVVPRPIALVTTVGPDGVVNAAPFSFFNVFSEDPALVVLGLQARPDGTPKDTLKHVRETRAFVVNLVDETI